MRDSGDLEGSIVVLIEVLNLHRAMYGNDDDDTLHVMETLGTMLDRVKRVPEAEKVFLEVVKLRLQKDPYDKLTREAINSLCAVLEKQYKMRASIYWGHYYTTQKISTVYNRLFGSSGNRVAPE